MAKTAGEKTKTEDNGPSKHLCKLFRKRKIKKIAELAKGANYVCRKCGRAAADRDNLCKPRKI